MFQYLQKYIYGTAILNGVTKRIHSRVIVQSNQPDRRVNIVQASPNYQDIYDIHLRIFRHSKMLRGV